jgi:hypothetical protein
MIVIGAALTLFFVPFTIYALSFNDSVPLSSEDRGSPAFVTGLATFATIGLIVLIIGIAPSEKMREPRDLERIWRRLGR